MDLKKTGELLRILRKERGWTQEMLAEQLNVSTRTISRWETGTSLPDLDLLLTLADRYQVDIRDLLMGERRKDAALDPVARETAEQLAGYSELEKRNLARRMAFFAWVGVAAFSLFLLMEGTGWNSSLWGDRIASFALGSAYGVGIVLALYISGVLARLGAKIKHSRRNPPTV